MAGPILLAALGLACAFRVMAVIKIRNARKKAKESRPESEENPPVAKENSKPAEGKPAGKDSDSQLKVGGMKERNSVEGSNLPRRQPKTHPLGDSTNSKTESCSKRSITTSHVPHYVVHNLSVEVEPSGEFLQPRRAENRSLSQNSRTVTQRKIGAQDTNTSYLVIPLHFTTTRPQTQPQPSPLPQESQNPVQLPGRQPSNLGQSPNRSLNPHRKIHPCAWCGAEQEQYCCGFGIFS